MDELLYEVYQQDRENKAHLIAKVKYYADAVAISKNWHSFRIIQDGALLREMNWK